jgi:hypothetical protein
MWFLSRGAELWWPLLPCLTHHVCFTVLLVFCHMLLVLCHPPPIAEQGLPNLPVLLCFPLCAQVQMGRGSIVSISLNVSQAEENRDTVAKTLYSNMFDWTIVKVSCVCSVYMSGRNLSQSGADLTLCCDGDLC